MISKLVLETAHHLWHMCNRLIFLIISTYYVLLDYIEPSITHEDLGYKNIKFPEHIAMSFTNESLDLKSIAKLITWCEQLKISYITLYDEYGKLKDYREDLSDLIIDHFDYRKPIDNLNIISREDGRLKFIKDVQELVKLPPEKINFHEVDKRVGWPTDPDILICFGSPLCLYGFPPWQLRLTEIFSVPTHKNLPKRVFVDCFKKYSKTSRREGT